MNNRTDSIFKYQNITTFDEEQCWAFSLHDYGHNVGSYLLIYMICDIGISNGIDLLCPAWWIAQKIMTRFCHFQRDLNKIFEGVDFKPYMRYQILLKFVFMGCLMNQVDGPRLMNFWVAVCFWTCMVLEKFCFVKYYRRGPKHGVEIFYTVVDWCMPFALVLHMMSSFATFAVSWNWFDPENKFSRINSIAPSLGESAFPVPDDPGRPMIHGFKTDVIKAFGLYWASAVIFIIAYLLPLKIWNFKSGETFGCGTQIHRRVMTDHSLYVSADDYLRTLPKDLTYSAALQAVEDQELGRENLLNKICRIEVQKYIPDPTRREFGLMFVN